jgi:hypothetical protein
MGPIKLPEPKKGKDPYAPWDNAWLITINTGTSIPELREALDICWDYFTKHASRFLVGRKGARLLGVEQYHRVEQGKKYHKIHLHGSFVAKCEGIAFLDFYKLTEYFNRNLRIMVPGFKRINFQAKLIKNYNQQRLIKEYIDKDKSETEEDGDED